MTRRKAVVVDVDGTISDVSRRLSQAMTVGTYKSVKFWDAFFQSEWVRLDKPIGYSQVALNAYKDAGYIIIYLSGRRNNLISASRSWLKKWGYPKGIIIFRPKGKNTKQFKREATRKLKRKYDIEVAFDNEMGMVTMFREEGIPEVIHIKTDSSQSWKEVLRGLHLSVTVDKWLGYKGSRDFPTWQEAVRWMRRNIRLRIKNRLKPVVKCVHCGFVSYVRAKKCTSCGAILK